MNPHALFDIVIPTLDIGMANATVESLRSHSMYPHNYIIMYNGDSPTGYVEPCNRGYKAGVCNVVMFVNDDVLITSDGWDELFLEEADRGTYCFSLWVPEEVNMRLNGWFLCQRRDYIDTYGWAFDPRFKLWCGDIDLMKRLEADNLEPVYVKGIECEHQYSATTSRADLQDLVIPLQVRDLAVYTEKWGTDPNLDKVMQ